MALELFVSSSGEHYLYGSTDYLKTYFDKDTNILESSTTVEFTMNDSGTTLDELDEEIEDWEGEGRLFGSGTATFGTVYASADYYSFDVQYDTDIYDNSGISLQNAVGLVVSPLSSADVGVEVGALYGYYATRNNFYPSDSGDDTLTGYEETNLIFGGDGDDLIFSGDTDTTNSALDTFEFQVEDSANDETFTGSFTSDGADFLFGNDDDDIVYGGTGDTVLSGGDGDDILFEFNIDGDENYLFGGEGSDVFILSMDEDSSSTSVSEDSIAESITDTTLAGLDATAAYFKDFWAAAKKSGQYLNLFLKYYDLAETAFNLMVELTESEEAEPADSDVTTNYFYDFDPTEDVLIIYTGDDDSVSFASEAYQINGEYGLLLESAVNDDNAIKQAAFLTGDFLSSSQSDTDSIAETAFNTALYIKEDSVEWLGKSFDKDDFSDVTDLLDTLDDYSSNLFIYGAWGPQVVYGTSGENAAIYGTKDYDDILLGYDTTVNSQTTDGADNLYGLGGDDWLTGGRDSDLLYGGDDSDTAFYDTSDVGITVMMAETTTDDSGEEYFEVYDGIELNTSGSQGLDQVYSIENIAGSPDDDIIVGDSSDNIFYGLSGDDIIAGGDGNDTIDYSLSLKLVEDTNGSSYYAIFTASDDDIQSIENEDQGITVDLSLQPDDFDYDFDYYNETFTEDTAVATEDGYGDVDYLFDIENVTGSIYDDNITGDENTNLLEGNEGDDTLEGRGGDDTLDGGTGTDDEDTDAGNDTASYSTASDSIVADLEAGTVSDGEGSTDTLIEIDNIIGSDFDDEINGDANDNILEGGAGQDTLNGGDGSDVMDGGAETDTVDYSDVDGPITITIDGDTGIITVEDGSGGVDTLSNIENFIGSSSDEDSLVASGNTSLDALSFASIENITDNTILETEADVVVTLLEDESDGNFSDDDLSLREALTLVEEGGTIGFDESLEGGTLALDSALGQLEIDKSLTIDGSGLDITIDADGNSRVIWVDDGDYSTQSTVEINGLTLVGGFVETDLSSNSDTATQGGSGAGIFNKEVLTLDSSTISGHTADYGAGVYNYFGSTLSIQNSSISGNTAKYQGGGVSLNFSTAAISNSTISGNSSDDGGGVHQLSGSLTVSNSTITGNIAGDDGGGIFRSSGQISITSSLIAGNTASDDGSEVHSSRGSDVSSGGNNLFGDDSQTEAEALTDVDLADSDITATSDGTNPTALENILETSLNDSGTHALVENSPAIDAGSNPDDLITDQRGSTRLVDGDGDDEATVDIGAYEYQTDTTASGTASNGPITAGRVYFDADFDNELDADEPSTITDANGDYDLTIPLETFDSNGNGQIDYEEGRLVITGGTDTVGDIPLYSDLWAAASSTMITPLTTMVQWLMQNGMEHDDAEARLKQVLEIEQSIDIHTFNPVEALQQGIDIEFAESTYLSHIRVGSLLHGVTHFLSGATGHSLEAVDELAVEVTATGLLSLGSLDMTRFPEPETVRSAFVDALQALDTDSSLQFNEDNARFLADSFFSTLQFVDRALSLVESQSLLEISTIIKPVVYRGIPEILEEVAARTITLEEAQVRLDELLGLTLGQLPTSGLVENLEEVIANSSIDLEQFLTELGINPELQTSNSDLAGSIPEIAVPPQPERVQMTNGNSKPTSASDQVLSDAEEGIYLLDGDDTLSAGDSNNWINGNQGRDLIDAGVGNDTVHGGQDNDTLFGSAGDDWMNGNLGADFLDGGEGMDTLYGGQDTDTLQGNAGDDWLSGNLSQDFITGGEDADTIFGGQDGDTLQGDSDNDQVFGNFGADLMEGNEGNDLLYGGQGDDTVSGNEGNDTISGDFGDDLLDGDVGTDILSGGQGNDTLDGGDGNDELTGNEGDDWLFGATGDDTLIGGAGRDQFVLTVNSGSDWIADFEKDNDLIVLNGLSFEQLSIDPAEDGTMVKLGEEVLATLGSVDSSFINADDFISLV